MCWRENFFHSQWCANHPTNLFMDRQTLFAALAKKQIPQFATSVLGFTIGSLMDYGVSEDEARELCGFLIDQISKAKKNPEIVDNVTQFSSLMDSSIAGGH
jgi:hypothetical protein